MKNKIILGIIVLVLIVLGLVLTKRSEAPTAEPSVNDELTASSTDQVASTSDSSTPLAKDPKTEAWDLFQKYLSYNKNQDLAGVKSLVYKISKVCDTTKPSDECKARMSSAYAHGSTLKKEDFINVWSDKRQTVLTTDFWTETSVELNLVGRFRSMIVFVRNEKGELKLLSFSPTKGGATAKNSAPEQELNDRIIRWSEDKDKDAIADYEEECLNKPDDTKCVKTNPKLRDTDADGFWDGVDALLDQVSTQ